jgi:hypothetical protein
MRQLWGWQIQRRLKVQAVSGRNAAEFDKEFL